MVFITMRIGLAAIMAGALLWPMAPAQGANVTLRTNDAVGSSSFTGSTNWNSAGVPSAGNAYFTGALTVRTTNTTTSGLTYPPSNSV